MKTKHPVSPDYLVTIDGVREVCLVGSADAAYWRERLGKEGLFPYPGGEKVEITLGAAAIRWKGINSLEFTLAVAVSSQPEGGSKDYFLVIAFNSSLFFAWIERTFFLSPFLQSSVRLVDRVPVSLGVYKNKTWFISGLMGAQGRPGRTVDETWRGTYYLPGDPILGIRRKFSALYEGRTSIYPFLGGLDNFWINPSSHRKVFNWLIDSHFSPQEWKIRQNALHARSVTQQSWKKKNP